jgi:hypothetical protein
MKGDKNRLIVFLKDIIYKQICFQKKRRECRSNLLRYLKVLEIEDFEYSEKFIKNLLFQKMKKKISETKITSVFIDFELDNKKITDVINLGIP